jgi:hypothetical protein
MPGLCRTENLPKLFSFMVNPFVPKFFVTRALDKEPDRGCDSNCLFTPLIGTADSIARPAGRDIAAEKSRERRIAKVELRTNIKTLRNNGIPVRSRPATAQTEVVLDWHRIKTETDPRWLYTCAIYAYLAPREREVLAGSVPGLCIACQLANRPACRSKLWFSERKRQVKIRHGRFVLAVDSKLFRGICTHPDRLQQFARQEVWRTAFR